MTGEQEKDELHFQINGGDTICGLNIYINESVKATRHADDVTCPKCIENYGLTYGLTYKKMLIKNREITGSE